MGYRDSRLATQQRLMVLEMKRGPDSDKRSRSCFGVIEFALAMR